MLTSCRRAGERHNLEVVFHNATLNLKLETYLNAAANSDSRSVQDASSSRTCPIHFSGPNSEGFGGGCFPSAALVGRDSPRPAGLRACGPRPSSRRRRASRVSGPELRTRIPGHLQKFHMCISLAVLASVLCNILADRFCISPKSCTESALTGEQLNILMRIPLREKFKYFDYQRRT